MTNSIQGATHSVSGSQALPEAASHLRLTGFDPSRNLLERRLRGSGAITWYHPDDAIPMEVVIISGGIGYRKDGRWYTLTGVRAPGLPIEWPVTAWTPMLFAPDAHEPAPAIDTEGEDAKRLSAKHESAIGEAEAPINSLMLSALKAMDAALTGLWGGPTGSGSDAEHFVDPDLLEAWIQIRSAIARADGGGKMTGKREGNEPSHETLEDYVAGLEVTEAICFDRLKTENKELREALRPFAQAADDCNFGPDTMTICDGMGLDLTIGHCRQARTLLSQSTEGGET